LPHNKFISLFYLSYLIRESMFLPYRAISSLERHVWLHVSPRHHLVIGRRRRRHGNRGHVAHQTEATSCVEAVGKHRVFERHSVWLYRRPWTANRSVYGRKFHCNIHVYRV